MNRLLRWFLLCGCVGAFAAVAVYALGSVPSLRTNVIFNPYVMMTLAPASILGLAEPTTFGDTAFLLGIVLATNFVLYGLLGLVLFGVWSFFRRPTT
jgi:hypothetical protein